MAEPGAGSPAHLPANAAEERTDPARSTRDPTSALFARIGVSREEGAQSLSTLGVWTADGPVWEDDRGWTAPAVVDALTTAPAPAPALRGLVRIVETYGVAAVRGDPHLIARLAALAAVSDALVDVAITHPEVLELLAGVLDPDLVERVRQRANQALAGQDDEGAAAGLARVQRLGLLRIAARDLIGLADTPSASAELADLAAGLLRAALDRAQRDEDVRVAVIGMGKLGGRELNYVSDVDVMFVHEGDGDAATRVCRRFLALLRERTADGQVYDVDANLRPEGRDGPLSRTLDAYRAYYDRWAHTWEYQALLKARPVAGDPELGRAFAELTAPYVWPDRRERDAIGEIQAMKTSVEESAAVQKAGSREVKLAPGGIRDIEFAVQLLQLVHGRHDPALRSPNTLEALASLADHGYVDEGDANLFGDAYQFLRTVEHRLQLRGLRRTHVVPQDEARRDRLARACGFRDIRAETAASQFDREYARVQSYVRRLHEKLFYRPLLGRFAELSASDQLVVDGAESELGHQAAIERLAALGFAVPERALRDLEALAGGVSRRARLLRALLPGMLATFAEAPDPDGGLSAFRELAERLEKTPQFLRTLQDNPPVGDVLARVLGQSRLVGEWLARQPELLPGLDGPELPGAEDLQRQAQGLLRRGEEAARASDSLRRLKRREIARTAVADLLGRADLAAVAGQLTALAEASLDAGVTLATGELPISFAVIGMGKLGGGEIGYASDLDVILVFEPAEARAEALEVADGLVRSLSEITREGFAFEVDLGLRPEGRDGPIARTPDSTVTYYRQWADSWEFQALTQARHVAGDASLSARVLEALTPLVYPVEPSSAREQAIRQMKARVERERAGGRRGIGVRRGDRTDLKLGPGGLADAEWTAQLLQLRHGGTHESLRVPGTLPALDALEREVILEAREAAWLRDGWRQLARIRNALYLAGHRETGLLPTGPGQLDHVARMLGYEAPGGQALTEDVGRAMRRVRKIHERRFYAG
ncbi:bifunctional [glutamine synthetase] adenylyltransferase/[glutamine synthetase]-adenylyl-L-tyrosine phosphorylase [Egibacter rhizosphaerae]|uniref:Bifunctional [glutamine synthetase] adenylyltransferase/[glutamine synthetase]-adenylyl-L-tyrosine phosphorylase n=1 Tax=Egibacter rhizosphaerae TaxID=1670831 RepID=A0A411YAK9_9ACTN|nr:bifunctional [glutamine synthetase] adenylyltransferase/[glutamine synthetase]-adenylyl-L-tyrosine phosphorylase [Egibacter rhizosphaerae]QBI18236.1 bifunctional [glutamine synthetase] adenylyltransferase/[glutamine synthetase]-adenylyl-L-tyrosine phosphorylase [Egibacter rhizosphaerae]